jgi:hypothetical protein
VQKAWAFMTQARDFAYCYVEEMRTRDWILWEQVSGTWVLFCSSLVYISLIAGTTWERVEYQSRERAFVQPRRTSTCTRNHSSSLLACPVNKCYRVQDPYFPPMKHSRGWHLKRSRSVGCLREVCPIPELGQGEGLPRRHEINEMDEG